MELHYIDTSFLAPYYLPEKASETIEKKLLGLPKGSVIISSLVRVEFASLLSRKFRIKELEESSARQAMMALDRHLNTEALRAIAITLQDFEQATEWIMTLKHSLRAPDALHLAVAARNCANFWTLDRRLAKVAKWLGLSTHR